MADWAKLADRLDKIEADLRTDDESRNKIVTILQMDLIALQSDLEGIKQRTNGSVADLGERLRSMDQRFDSYLGSKGIPLQRDLDELKTLIRVMDSTLSGCLGKMLQLQDRVETLEGKVYG